MIQSLCLGSHERGKSWTLSVSAPALFLPWKFPARAFQISLLIQSKKSLRKASHLLTLKAKQEKGGIR